MCMLTEICMVYQHVFFMCDTEYTNGLVQDCSNPIVDFQKSCDAFQISDHVAKMSDQLKPFKFHSGMDSHGLWARNGIDPWWRHQMKTFSALLAFFVANSPVTGHTPTWPRPKRPQSEKATNRKGRRLNQQQTEMTTHRIGQKPKWPHEMDNPKKILTSDTAFGGVHAIIDLENPMCKLVQLMAHKQKTGYIKHNVVLVYC